MFSIHRCRSNNAHKIDSHPFYSKPCRVAIPVTQGLIIMCNLAITITGCLMMVFDDLTYQDDGLAFVSFLIWVLIPLILLITSVVDVVKRRKRTLRSRYAVASAALGFILWVGYALESLIDPKQTWNASEYLYINLAFFAIPGLVLYPIYFAFGIMAWRRERTWTPPLTRSDNFELERSSAPRQSETSDLSKHDKV